MKKIGCVLLFLVTLFSLIGCQEASIENAVSEDDSSEIYDPDDKVSESKGSEGKDSENKDSEGKRANNLDLRIKNFSHDPGWNSTVTIDTTEYLSSNMAVIDNNGDAIVIWTKDNRLVSRNYKLNYGWSEIEYLQTSSANVKSPKIAIDDNGNAIAVWMEKNSLLAGGGKTVWSNRYVKGDGWGVAKKLSDSDKIGLIDIAVDNTGNAIAIWQQNDELSQIYINKFSTTSGWGDAEKLVGGEDSITLIPGQIAFDNNGNAIALWIKRQASSQSIYARHYEKSTGLWGVETLIVTDNFNESSSDPGLVLDSHGNAIVAWRHKNSTKKLSVGIIRYDSILGWGIPEFINSPSGSPHIAVDGDGNAVLVWHYSSLLYFSQSINSGAWSEPELFAAAEGFGQPEIGMDNEGNVSVVWTRFIDNRPSVYASRYQPGKSWDSPTLIEHDNSASALLSNIAVNVHGDALTVWQTYGSTDDNHLLNVNYYNAIDDTVVVDADSSDAGNSASPDSDTGNGGIDNNKNSDIDGDGVVDTLDDFPLDEDESLDTDNDGIGNNADSDDDGDGVIDVLDDFPLDANESIDTDSDGIGNNADTDDDGDGVDDTVIQEPVDNPVSSRFSLSQFSVDYYNNNLLIASELVDKPSINYSWNNFKDIQATDFSATWSGEITVSGDVAHVIDIDFSVSWSEVSLIIDDEEIDSWANNSKTIKHMFQPGTYSIKINYTNNYHTVGFNTSFTDSAQTSFDAASPVIQSMIEPDDKIVYVGAYEADHIYNEVSITLNKYTTPVVLFLSSYHAVNWVVNNPHDIVIKGIIYSSYHPRSTVAANEDITQLEIDGLQTGYDDFSDPTTDIMTLTGRSPDQLYGKYALGEVIAEDPDSASSTSFTLSQFSVDYYNDETLVASELVDTPSINYSWSDFKAIPASDFSASWRGEITVSGDFSHAINIEFNVSWSEVLLTVDGVEIDSWVNSDNAIKYLFTPGTHTIEIHYINNYHTVEFSTSFMDAE